MEQPLQIRWVEDGVAAVYKAGVEVGRFVARRTLVTDPHYVDFNAKTAGVVAMVKDLQYWCGRSLTGFERCDVPCYADDSSPGCYANATQHALFLKNKGFCVTRNGFAPGTETYGYMQLPKYDSYDLTPAKRRLGRTRMIFRVDSETSDASASLALGLMQRWAEANPRDWFVAISSNYFHVPDDMLTWAAALPNLIVGHTVGPWFGVDDLQNRVAALGRYHDAGVRTQVWLATRPSWTATPEQQDLIDSAISSVLPTQVIEVAYHDRKVGHESTTANINPLGVCCEVQGDSKGRRVKHGQVEVDGKMVPVKGQIWGKCKSCRLLCGVAHEVKSRRGVA